MLQAVSRGLDRLYLFAGILAGVFMVLLCLLVLYSIAARLLQTYAGGVTDASGYVMAASTFMALAYTFRTNGHIRVQLIAQKLSGGSRRRLEIICLVLMSGAAAYIAWYMTRLAIDSYEFGERSQGADAILLWIPQTPMAIGAWLFTVAVVHTLIQSVFDYDAVNPELSEGPGEV